MNKVESEVYRVVHDEGIAVLDIDVGGADVLVTIVVKATNNRNNIFFSGMGKCSFIAGKLAATYSSLGIPSFELDCSHALHGDIGSVRCGDVVFILSKSGETDEALDLASSLKKFGATSIAITCTTNSSLAKICDFSFVIPVNEACHLGLAPTTSTTVMLAFGDAIGVVSSKEINFGKSDFHKRHTKGKLGVECSDSFTNL